MFQDAEGTRFFRTMEGLRVIFPTAFARGDFYKEHAKHGRGARDAAMGVFYEA
jgi:hypothetical protein